MEGTLRMTGPSADAPPPWTAQAEAVVGEWTRRVARAGLLPLGRARTRVALEGLLRQILAELHANTPEPKTGERIGRQLVDLRMSSPDAIGATATLLAQRLPALVAPGRHARIPDLIGRICAGFSAAQRVVAVRAAEDMNRVQKVFWGDTFEAYRRELRRVQMTDPQSGLPNRAYLREHLSAISAGHLSDTRIGLCLFSIDRFEQLSDAYGPDDITHVLAAIADRLEAVAVRNAYFLAHLGDDLFAYVVTTTTVENLGKVAHQAVTALREPVYIHDGNQLRITITTGLVEGPPNGTDPDAWVRDARCALRWAHHDQQPLAVFNPARAATDRQRQKLASAMPAAIDRRGFLPYYQPIFELVTHRIVAVEALARWQTPDRLLGPQEFIALAEQTGLIRSLGRQILRQACENTAVWRRLGYDLLLSVNLSPYQLAEPGLVAAVAAILDDTGLPAACLQLEITESAAIEQHRTIVETLAELGIRIAIDDFGTGYSNLAILTRIPVTCLKLDAAFVRDLDNDEHSATAVLRRTKQLCTDLAIKTVVEGIETTAQEHTLNRLGFTHGQGYLFAQPMPADQLTQLLSQTAARTPAN
jgi:diguanylate cyclase (GGDEF)-like protein